MDVSDEESNQDITNAIRHVNRAKTVTMADLLPEKSKQWGFVYWIV
jgi:hypothetical protein